MAAARAMTPTSTAKLTLHDAVLLKYADDPVLYHMRVILVPVQMEGETGWTADLASTFLVATPDSDVYIINLRQPGRFVDVVEWDRLGDLPAGIRERQVYSGSLSKAEATQLLQVNLQEVSNFRRDNGLEPMPLWLKGLSSRVRQAKGAGLFDSLFMGTSHSQSPSVAPELPSYIAEKLKDEQMLPRERRLLAVEEKEEGIGKQ
jgi:hypothetical protein